MKPVMTCEAQCWALRKMEERKLYSTVCACCEGERKDTIGLCKKRRRLERRTPDGGIPQREEVRWF